MEASVMLDEEGERLLAGLAERFGGRREAVVTALRRLAADVDREDGLNAFAKAFDEAWSADGGPIDERAVDLMIEKIDKLA